MRNLIYNTYSELRGDNSCGRNGGRRFKAVGQGQPCGRRFQRLLESHEPPSQPEPVPNRCVTEKRKLQLRNIMYHTKNIVFPLLGSQSDEERSDDEFESLTAQRKIHNLRIIMLPFLTERQLQYILGSFYIDAVCGTEDSPLENEKDMQEWAEREARSLGLIGK